MTLTEEGIEYRLTAGFGYMMEQNYRKDWGIPNTDVLLVINSYVNDIFSVLKFEYWSCDRNAGIINLVKYDYTPKHTYVYHVRRMYGGSEICAHDICNQVFNGQRYNYHNIGNKTTYVDVPKTMIPYPKQMLLKDFYTYRRSGWKEHSAIILCPCAVPFATMPVYERASMQPKFVTYTHRGKKCTKLSTRLPENVRTKPGLVIRPHSGSEWYNTRSTDTSEYIHVDCTEQQIQFVDHEEDINEWFRSKYRDEHRPTNNNVQSDDEPMSEDNVQCNVVTQTSEDNVQCNVVTQTSEDNVQCNVVTQTSEDNVQCNVVTQTSEDNMHPQTSNVTEETLPPPITPKLKKKKTKPTTGAPDVPRPPIQTAPPSPTLLGAVSNIYKYAVSELSKLF